MNLQPLVLMVDKFPSTHNLEHGVDLQPQVVYAAIRFTHRKLYNFFIQL